MHSIFPVFIIFSSYRSFLFPGYTFPIASFVGVQGIVVWFCRDFSPGSLSPCIFHVHITLGAINTN